MSIKRSKQDADCSLEGEDYYKMSLRRYNIEKIIYEKQFIKRAAQLIVNKAKESIAKNGKFSFVLSGGTTPKDIFVALATKHKYSIDWSKVHLFWLDERCVKPTHESSNYKLANDYLISRLDSIGSVQRIDGELEPTEAASEYEKILLNFFGNSQICFDCILLGMGEDGHVASLFPNSKELHERDKIVLATSEQYNGFYRITLGLDTINCSKCNILLLRGSIKYERFKKYDSLPKDLIMFHKILVLL